nr:Chain L, Reaction center protein L chain [Roseiflexus castenholzii DSM 13941]8HJV_L Chain L, Reaction center protein L chain [Roseiflexus castenholzii DSM 13941]8J5O_L Chain L, Reaction center protein L chain [Roseiflexus castenholzii DSM 13941]8J5P_L Chain L, Reaction center protein L chain [Roseiflexus castenholzii DSM 13941]
MSAVPRALPLPSGETLPAEAISSTGSQAASAEVIPFSIIEEFYKRPGKTLAARFFGVDPFDFWIGRFYVGLFGAISIIGIILGVAFYLYEGVVNEGTLNILAMRIEPPPVSQGLNVDPAQPGFFWFLTMVAATIAFVGWLLRQIDISLKLDMGMEVPIAFGAVVSSWITLQWLRPIAMGAWGHGFPLGITHHLDWVSNIGYQYYNFFYNPFHAIGITLLFASTLFLHMHGSAVLSEAKRNISDQNIHVFWRNILGYSIGEIGIHRVAFWTGAASVLFSNLCIFLSGTFVKDWNAFWGFWDKMPIWNGVGQGALVA